jgi:hypothetical protein
VEAVEVEVVGMVGVEEEQVDNLSQHDIIVLDLGL